MRFTETECNEIIKYAKQAGLQHITNLASDLSSKYTDYNFITISKNQDILWAFERILEFIKVEHPTATIEGLQSINIHQFHKGGKFVKHVDKVREPHFYYIVGTTLSDKFEGGDLLAYNPDENLSKEKGKLYKMYADRPHEVTEITKGERWSLVMFLSREQLGYKKRLI